MTTEHTKPRCIDWDLDRASLRDLGALILTERADEVTVTTRNPESLRGVERLGYPIEPGVHIAEGNGSRLTCRLLPHLSLSMLPVKEHRYRVTDEDIRRFGEISGDFNPIHFSDDVARSLGFEGRIAHGMLFQSWFTRLLGMEFPGPGTLYLQSHSLFIAPVYPEREYRVRISTPRYDAQRGGFRIAAQLTDAARGRHALIAYADVLNRPKLEPAGAP